LIATGTVHGPVGKFPKIGFLRGVTVLASGSAGGLTTRDALRRMTLEPKNLYMRAAILMLCATVTTGLLIAVPLRAQSLADVARAEEARRKEVKQPSKVYTNKDLPSVPAPTAPPLASPADATEKSAEKGSASATGEKTDGDNTAKAPASEAAKEKPRDQAYWSGRLKELQTQLDRDQTFAQALQTRINSLTTDFTARDDAAQRDAIGRDRLKALDELDRLKKSIQADKTAIADFQEEARRASVPPGWLR